MPDSPSTLGKTVRDARLAWWRLALWFGLLAGLGEVASAGIRKFVLHRVLFLSRDMVWMAPLTDLALFTLAGAGLAVAARLLPRVVRPGTVILLLASMAAAATLFMYPALHRVAGTLLSLGVGAQISRMAGRNPDGFSRLVRKTLLPLGVLLGLIAGGSLGLRAWRERHAMASLPPPAAKAPNVLLIVWDTVRRDNLSLYGYGRPTTPQLDRLAHGGVRFDHAIVTAPWTLPSHASMFTGLWPHEHGADWLAGLDRRAPVLAEAFASAGYRTGGFVANMYYCGYEHGLQRGFAHYDDYRVTPGEVLYSASLGRLVCNASRVRRLVGYHKEVGFNDAEIVNQMFLRWLDRSGDRPFFCFLNYFDAHDPRLPPKPWDAKFGDPARRPLFRIIHREHHAAMTGMRAFSREQLQDDVDAYDGAIAYMDNEVGVLIDELRRRGKLDDTIVIITSDHGESFGEHGEISHGRSLYRHQIEVPLLVIYPTRLPGGRSVETPVSLRDLAATVSDLAGLGPRFPGRSWLRLLVNTPAPPPADLLLSELTARRNPGPSSRVGSGMRSIVLDGLTYIANGNHTEELYDFSRDPQQLTNLAKDGSDPRLPRLREALAAIPVAPGASTPATPSGQAAGRN